MVPDGDDGEGGGASCVSSRVVAALPEPFPCPVLKNGGRLGLFSGICKLRAALASRRRGCDRPRVGSVKWAG